ncbi:hypothetical protein D7X55_21545 [Corallococcus sp. AB049A]|uniref:N-acetyltransferase n=1 Tax=Corallococcus interemptor TaxID=2316720 RepID=A0A3A8QFG2_9BACT|nr:MULTISPECIES: hypothetical protein [Corallococcus]RKH67433.1 hypothetical protein D7X96_19560 [Corallococcus interemptor]RKI62953.1 hypothetical protein D7X55_21545 [Corallococcus sp. AB049A]
MTDGTRPILIEGYTAAEVLRMADQELSSFALTGEPVVIRIGSAELLGCFRLQSDTLIVELAHIESGGEGVLPTFWNLVRRLARARGVGSIEWVVHAVRCARPNLKLRRVLERRGFVVRILPGIGEAYFLLDVLPALSTTDSQAQR